MIVISLFPVVIKGSKSIWSSICLFLMLSLIKYNSLSNELELIKCKLATGISRCEKWFLSHRNQPTTKSSNAENHIPYIDTRLERPF